MSKAQELIKKEGLVGMIITDPYNMRHISGFRGGEGALYISATQQVLITDSRYTEQAEKESDFTIVQEHRGHTREQIREQMKKDGTDFVWEDLRTIPRDELVSHFPNIIEHCKEMGYDVFKEPIPVVPAQHYFMGGVKVNHHSRTSMECLYAVGETACNGVHGRNRLASNSLLESLVFAKRAAGQMAELGFVNDEIAAKKAADSIDLADYSDEKAVEREYRKLAMEAIEGRTSVENESGVTYIQA